jgi:hypothetical protein
MRASPTTVWVLAAMAAALTIARTAAAIERNFAASAQLDYHLVPGDLGRNRDSGALAGFDGFTLETALKLAADVSDHVSANVKVCYGCHGFEADMAYFDLRAADELNVRVGRFSPSFGNYNLRHDPANHKLSDKPLPYDMGRMLRKNVWSNGVLPSPFPDNGVELNGTHWFGESAQLDYALYAVMGFKQSGDYPSDLSFQESHLPYYVDNNALPSFGARVALTGKLGPTADLTLGASGMGGTYDPKDRLIYVIAGADFTTRIDRTTLRMEYLVRRQQFDTSEAIFKYVIAKRNGDFFVKHGAFVELEQPIGRALDVIARVDGMVRTGNVVQGSELSSRSWVVRETLGLALLVERNLRLKGSGELWRFSDPDERERRSELSFHLGAVGTF